MIFGYGWRSDTQAGHVKNPGPDVARSRLMRDGFLAGLLEIGRLHSARSERATRRGLPADGGRRS